MSDQNGGHGEDKETDTKPVAGSDALSGRTRAAPVIEGHAVEVPSPVVETTAKEPIDEPTPVHAAEAAPSEAEGVATPESPASEPGASEPEVSANEPPRKSGGGFRAFGLLAGVAILGAGGYYGWTEIGSPDPSDIPARISALLTPSAVKPSAQPETEKAAPAVSQSAAAPNAAPAGEATKKAEAGSGAASTPEKAAPQPAAEKPPAAGAEKHSEAAAGGAEKQPSPAEAPATAAPGAAPSAEAPVAAETKPNAQTAPETAAPQPSAEANKPAAGSEKQAAPSAAPAVSAPSDVSAGGSEKTAPPAAGEAMKKTEAPAARQNAAANVSGESATDKALVAQMAAQLATTQATVQQLSQKLKAVEDQLAAPKADAGEASAKLVVAQSLLTAIRQGDNYAPMLAALQNFSGGDADRLARLRAGLAAPSASKLAQEFSDLAPKLLASAATPAPQPAETKAPRNFGESALAYIEARARTLVRISPANAPGADANAARIDRIGQDLARDDIAAALAERLQLPAPALALSADWAKAAQTRLDAEAAAKAQVDEALQNLSKTKS